MVKVKICGVTNLEDAVDALECGADMLGFNFYEKSPRYILPDAARHIISQLPDSILGIGVFVNGSVSHILEIEEIGGLNAIQLHGDETSEFVSKLRQRTNAEIIKAVRVADDFVAADVLSYGSDAILLDAYSPLERGGTGESFEWNKAVDTSRYVTKLFLAGGLRPENVADAVRTVRPYAVDVASGVESAPGKKDMKKVEAFVRNAKNA